jgi:hypothetical protein
MYYILTQQCTTYWHTNVLHTDTPMYYILTHQCATYWHTNVLHTDIPMYYILTHQCTTYWHTNVLHTDTPMCYILTHKCTTYWHTNVKARKKIPMTWHIDGGYYKMHSGHIIILIKMQISNLVRTTS